MPDRFSKEVRSRIMSRIRSKNTKPELLLKKMLVGTYFRYQPKGILGNPDFASKKQKIAIFVDGCFWHGYDWGVRKKIPPKGFWRKKILRNMSRDKEYSKALRSNGWKVIRVWEHKVIDSSVRKIQAFKNLKR